MSLLAGDHHDAPHSAHPRQGHLTLLRAPRRLPGGDNISINSKNISSKNKKYFKKQQKYFHRQQQLFQFVHVAGGAPGAGRGPVPGDQLGVQAALQEGEGEPPAPLRQEARPQRPRLLPRRGPRRPRLPPARRDHRDGRLLARSASALHCQHIFSRPK